MLPLVYHVYFVVVGVILGRVHDMAALTIGCFYIIFSWFHVSIFLDTNPMDFSNGSYCPLCRTVTGMGLRHCHQCKKCVNDKWEHCGILKRCADTALRKRWLYLFKFVVLLFSALSLIYSMLDWRYSLLMVVHLYILKTTYLKRGINKKHGDFK